MPASGRTPLEQQVIEVIAAQLGIKAEDIQPSSSFIDDLGADSLDIVELVMGMEEKFGLEIPDQEAEKILTVQDAINHIAGFLSSQEHHGKS
ncbi:MAG: acyl carrier protein [Myxococcota bacterium]